MSCYLLGSSKSHPCSSIIYQHVMLVKERRHLVCVDGLGSHHGERVRMFRSACARVTATSLLSTGAGSSTALKATVRRTHCPGAARPEHAALCSQPPGSSPFVLRPSLLLPPTGEGYTALRYLSQHLLIRLSHLEGRNMSSPSL